MKKKLFKILSAINNENVFLISLSFLHFFLSLSSFLLVKYLPISVANQMFLACVLTIGLTFIWLFLLVLFAGLKEYNNKEKLHKEKLHKEKLHKRKIR